MIQLGGGATALRAFGILIVIVSTACGVCAAAAAAAADAADAAADADAAAAAAAAVQQKNPSMHCSSHAPNPMLKLIENARVFAADGGTAAVRARARRSFTSHTEKL